MFHRELGYFGRVPSDDVLQAWHVPVAEPEERDKNNIVMIFFLLKIYPILLMSIGAIPIIRSSNPLVHSFNRYCGAAKHKVPRRAKIRM